MVDEWTRYQFDNAVLWFCITIENALAEREEIKAGKRTESRQLYQLDDLLRDDFRIPRPPTKLEKRVQGAANLIGLAGDPRSGVKLWREKRAGEE